MKFLLPSAIAGLCVVVALFVVPAREAMIHEAPLLPLYFNHDDHLKVSCLECHHEFVDETRQGDCIGCHKRSVELRREIEEDFHDLCRDCHIQLTAEGEDTGPVRGCFDCHQPDDRF